METDWRSERVGDGGKLFLEVSRAARERAHSSFCWATPMMDPELQFERRNRSFLDRELRFERRNRSFLLRYCDFWNSSSPIKGKLAKSERSIEKTLVQNAQRNEDIRRILESFPASWDER